MGEKFKNWLELRERSKDVFGDMRANCGHPDKCNCDNPTTFLFKDSIERRFGFKRRKKRLEVGKIQLRILQMCISFLACVSHLYLKP